MNEHPTSAKELWYWLRWTIVLGCGVGLACQAPPQATPSTSPQATQAQAIIGGQPDLRHPEVGALTSNGRPFCTGTLIATRVVLTAAHCVDAALNYAKSANVQFRIDTPDTTATSGYKINLFDFDTALFKNHPKWNTNVQNGGDIGVGILKSPVTIATPMPANLRPMGPEWKGRKLLMLGYGLTQSVPNAVSADRKYAVELPITQLDADRFVHYEKGKSVCHGDSGGPAIFLVDGRQRVLGVNSYVSAASAPGANPPRSSCSGTGTSMRTDTLSTFISAILDTYGDGPDTCKQDEQCGQCGQCSANGLCEAATIAATPKACQPCRDDKDCGGGICYRFDDGYRCLQPCNAKGCCPDQTYCSRERTHQGFQDLCVPFDGACPAHPCQQSSDCGPGEFCENNACKPQPLARSPQLCKPCIQHSECGKDSFCFGIDGYKRCTQACDKGDFCPADTRCQELYPGLPRQCIPTQGSCLEPCQFSSHCGAGHICQEGKCVDQQQGGYGAPCDPGICKGPLQCVDTLTGKRCLQPCGPPPGNAGSSCRNGNNCDNGANCYALSSERRMCFQGCQTTTDCKITGGGFCNQGICLCTSDSDCSTSNACNFNPEFAGACAPKDLSPPCPASHTCKPMGGDSYCVTSTPGERAMGQSCDAINRCQDGLICLQTQDAAGVCFELCGGQTSCRLGGQCVQYQSLRLCLCNDDGQCRTGRSCHIALNNRFGYCETQSLTNPCLDHKECPTDFRCDAGQCKPGKASEPAPEPTPEPTPEPATEAAPDAATTEARPEPVAEVPTPEARPEVPETRDQDTQPAEATAPKKGCGCTTGAPTPTSFWMLLCLLPLLRRRRILTAPSKGQTPCA